MGGEWLGARSPPLPSHVFSHSATSITVTAPLSCGGLAPLAQRYLPSPQARIPKVENSIWLLDIGVISTCFVFATLVECGGSLPAFTFLRHPLPACFHSLAAAPLPWSPSPR